MAIASAAIGLPVACALWLTGRLLGHRGIDLTSPTPWLLLILPAVALSCALQHVYSTGRKH
ncbi:hypothetical protein CDN99_27410 [Roseateles aquatilis]|uniref:Uncharacterized protein n=2 Tax=Roseateles aquatilis TaxID=431061 RepID=A0A2D0ALR7_9BURK|nr:hypothetical protein CDN99_27410 [Roseateles aquatilis]